jgi:integrase/recombinase XerC
VTVQAPEGAPIATLREEARIDAFIAGLRARGRRPATLEAYRGDWHDLAHWAFATSGRPFDLSEIGSMDAADWRGHLIRNYKPSTVARRLLWLRSYAAEAFRAHEVAQHVYERIEALRPPKAQLAAPRGLTADEARAALRKVDKHGSARDRAILYTFLLTGVRVGELAGLRRPDLQLGERAGEIRIRSEIGKGGKSRAVPVPKEARLQLHEYLVSRSDVSPYLFVGQRGPLTTRGIRDIVVQFSGVSPHRLRHTFAYEYLRDNANDLVALADILGHESLNTTRTYTRRRKEDLQEGVERVRYARDPDKK